MRSSGEPAVNASVVDASWDRVMDMLRAHGIKGSQRRWDALSSRKFHTHDHCLKAAHELLPALREVVEEGLRIVAWETAADGGLFGASDSYMGYVYGHGGISANPKFPYRTWTAPGEHRNTDGELIIGIMPEYYQFHTQYQNALAKERAECTTRGGWYDFREYLCRRGLKWGHSTVVEEVASPNQGSSIIRIRRVGVEQGAYELVTDPTNLSLQAIAVKHNVKFLCYQERMGYETVEIVPV